MNVIRLRPVSLPWQCHQSGECCEAISDVVMTHAERDEIERAAPSGVVLSFTPHEDSRFVRLAASPCPLLQRSEDGKARCAVYAVRPTNCRRWGCFRPSPEEVMSWDHGYLGAANVRERFGQDRGVRAQLRRMERTAMAEWGHAHGWSE